MKAPSLRVFQFDEFEADEALRELRHRGEPVAIQPTPLRVLFFLLEHSGRVVSKEELLARGWPGVAVGQAALASAIRDLRRVLTRVGACDSPIRTVHGQGFRLALPVRTTPAGAGSGHVSAIDRPSAVDPSVELMDREQELAVLQAALDDARQGQGHLCLLVGPAGIGKTHTARHLARRAEATGARVYPAWCDEADANPPFSVWAQIVRGMLREADPALNAPSADWNRAALVPLVPELARPETDTPLPELTPDLQRLRLFDALVGLMTNDSAEAPRVLILDDLHWSDDASLRVLRHLIRQLPTSHTLVVATLRESEVGPEPELLRVLASVARHPLCTKLRLHGLSGAWIERTVEAQTGRLVPPDLLRRIQEATGGNPFFVTEIARLLASAPTEAMDLGDAGSGLPLPESVRDATQALLSQRTPGCRALLALAACVGTEFQPALLARVGARSSSDLLQALAESERADLISARPANGAYAFTHPLVRDAIYAGLTEAERMGLHASIGLALESIYGDQPDAHIMELSHSFYQAAPAGFARKAATYSQRAAQCCFDAFAWVEAERYQRRALESIAMLDAPDPAIECQVLLDRAVTLMRARVEARPDWAQTARENLGRAIELGRNAGDIERIARAAIELANLHLYSATSFLERPSRRADRIRLARLLRETRDAYDPTATRMRSRLTRRLAQLALLDEDISPAAASVEAELMCRAALEEAESLDNREVAELLLTVWRNLGVDQLAERQAIVKRLREPTGCERDRTFRRAAAAYADLVDQMELGNLSGADEALPEILAAEKEIRSRTEVEAIFRVMRAALQGHFSEAEERLRDIDAFMQKLGHEDTRRILTYNTLLFGLRCTQGLLDEMLDLLRMTAAWSPHAMLQTGLAYGCAQTGLLDEARDAFQRSEEAPLARDQSWLVVQALRAEASVRLEERASARALYRELLPFADRVAVVGGLYVCLGAVARPLALLADAVGDAEQSWQHFEQAIRINERLGARPWVARCQIDYAQALTKSSSRAQNERARHLLDAAARTAEALGLHHWLSWREVRT